jgi:hypothetical protein
MAMARLGKAYGDIRALRPGPPSALEDYYARKYAGERDALDAISDAVYFLKGIGNDAKATSEDTEVLRCERSAR